MQEKDLIQEILDRDGVNYSIRGSTYITGPIGFRVNCLDRNYARGELYSDLMDTRDEGFTLFQLPSAVPAVKLRNFIRSKLVRHERLNARDCTVEEISQASFDQINEKWHIQSKCQSHIRLALIHPKFGIVAAMGFVLVSGSWYLNRLVYTDKAVMGGASKLLSSFNSMKDCPEIITFSNNAYSDGSVYSKIGFTLSGESKDDLWYAKDGRLFNRRMFQKKKLHSLLEKYDPDLTEVQNMVLNGYFTYYGPGTKKWVMPGNR